MSESDFDLLVVTSEKGCVRRRISDFNRSSERKVVPIIVDANEFASLRREDRPIYENILRVIILWETE